MNGGLKFHASRDPWSMGTDIELRVALFSAEGAIYAAEPLKINTVPIVKGTIIPTFARIGINEAQTLADALWDAGIRPAGAAGSAGQLGAVLAHLGDMRAIVAAKLNVPLSGKAATP